MSELMYVLSFYRDGSGTPKLRFFDEDDALSAAQYVAAEKDKGKHCVVERVPVNFNEE